MKNLIVGTTDAKFVILKFDELRREEYTVYAYRDGELVGIFPEHSLAYLYVTEESKKYENENKT